MILLPRTPEYGQGMSDHTQQANIHYFVEGMWVAKGGSMFLVAKHLFKKDLFMYYI